MITWDAVTSSFLRDGVPIPPQLVSGAADALCSEIAANMRVISDRLQAGLISIDEWKAGMRGLIKSNVIAQKALARGGFDYLSPAILRSCEAEIAAQLKYLDGFATDVFRGRYGTGVLNGNFGQRAGMYADAGRSIYENERVAAKKESGFTEAIRIKGAVDSCPGCIEAASEGWVSINKVLPIGAAQCGSKCHCIIEVRVAA